MEGVRTEELSGSNLHKLSKSSYQKRTKNFSHSLPILYQIKPQKSRISKSLSLELPTDCIGFTDILPFYIWGFLKLRKETISFSIVSVSIILLSQKRARQPMSLSLE